MDMTASNAGRIALSTTVAGSVTGSVTGLVVADGIRGAIASGKKGRGASSDERYQFGDIKRGSIRAIKETAKTGRSMREEDSPGNQIGDFRRGASVTMKEYVKGNDARWGAAGGSTIGMMVGLAALGPIGLVAGSIAGARAGAKIFNSNKSDELNDDDPIRSQNNEVDFFSECAPANDATRDNLWPNVPNESGAEKVGSFGQNNMQSLDGFPHPCQRHNQSGSKVANHPMPVENNNFDPFDPQLQPMQLQAREPPPLKQSYIHSSQEYAPFSVGSQPHTTQSFDLLAVDGNRNSYCSPSLQQDKHTPDNANRYDLLEMDQPKGLTNANPYQMEDKFNTRAPGIQESAASHHIHEATSRQTNQSGYQFGDFTRSIINKGRQNSGRSEHDSYKFGDFTRGLFGSKK